MWSLPFKIKHSKRDYKKRRNVKKKTRILLYNIAGCMKYPKQNILLHSSRNILNEIARKE